MTLPVKKIASEVVNKTKTKANNVYQKNDKTIQNIGISVFVVGATFFIGRAVVRKIRRNHSERNVTDNLNTQQAMLLRSAMNPSGVSWLMWSDGTVEKAIYRIAAQINDFNAISKEYRNLYNSSLIVDLQKELRQDEFTKFMNIANAKNGNRKNNTSGVDYTDKLKMVYTTKNTKFYDGTSFVGVPFAGKDLPINTIPKAFTTGREFKLSLFGLMPNVTTVVELKTRTKERGIHLLYIDKEDVIIFDKEKYGEYSKIKNSYQFNESDF